MRKFNRFEDISADDYKHNLVNERGGEIAYEGLKWNLLEPNLYGGQIIFSEGDYTWCIEIDMDAAYTSKQDLIRYIQQFDLDEVHVSVIETSYRTLIVRSCCAFSLSPNGDGWEF